LIGSGKTAARSLLEFLVDEKAGKIHSDKRLWHQTRALICGLDLTENPFFLIFAGSTCDWRFHPVDPSGLFGGQRRRFRFLQAS
jgi:alkaline phosphatase